MNGRRTARAAGGILVAFASRFQPRMAEINHELSDTIDLLNILEKTLEKNNLTSYKHKEEKNMVESDDNNNDISREGNKKNLVENILKIFSEHCGMLSFSDKTLGDLHKKSEEQLKLYHEELCKNIGTHGSIYKKYVYGLITAEESLKLLETDPVGTFVFRQSVQFSNCLMIRMVLAKDQVIEYKVDLNKYTVEDIEKMILYFPHLRQWKNQNGIIPVEGKEPMELRAKYKGKEYEVNYDKDGIIASFKVDGKEYEVNHDKDGIITSFKVDGVDKVIKAEPTRKRDGLSLFEQLAMLADILSKEFQETKPSESASEAPLDAVKDPIKTEESELEKIWDEVEVAREQPDQADTNLQIPIQRLSHIADHLDPLNVMTNNSSNSGLRTHSMFSQKTEIDPQIPEDFKKLVEDGKTNNKQTIASRNSEDIENMLEFRNEFKKTFTPRSCM